MTDEEYEAEVRRTYNAYHKPKAKPKRHPEKLARDKIVKHLESIGALVLNTPAGLMTVEGRTFQTGQAGRADLHACYRGRFIAVETKAPGKAASPAQLRYLDRVRQAGGIAVVADSVDDVVQVTDRM